MNYDIYLNFTHYCNVDCVRCYLSTEERKDRSVISLEHLEKFVAFESFKSNGGEGVNVSWLGGEVTALSVTLLEQYRAIIKKHLPKAKNIIITNLYSLSSRHVKFIKETFETIETTYAEGFKRSLTGSEKEYKCNFIKNMKKLKDAGLDTFVNVELNDATYAKDPKWLLDIARETGQLNWEFDLSVRFDTVFEVLSQGGNPLNEQSYPSHPPLTISYHQWSEYVKRYLTEYADECKELGVKIGFFSAAVEKNHDAFFSTTNSSHIFSLTPNGSVFGTPIYTGIAPLSYGHLDQNTEEEIVSAPLRLNHVYYENVIRMENAICHTCRFFNECKGGFSSVPVEDGSGECAGMYSLRSYLEDEYIPNMKKDVTNWQLV